MVLRPGLLYLGRFEGGATLELDVCLFWHLMQEQTNGDQHGKPPVDKPFLEVLVPVLARNCTDKVSV